MSRNSYTASERRGVLAIALVVLLIIATGLGISLIGNGTSEEIEAAPVVKEYPEMVDSIAVETKKEKSDKNKKGKQSNKKNKTKSAAKSKSKKETRKRSPLDEPV